LRPPFGGVFSRVGLTAAGCAAEAEAEDAPEAAATEVCQPDQGSASEVGDCHLMLLLLLLLLLLVLPLLFLLMLLLLLLLLLFFLLNLNVGVVSVDRLLNACGLACDACNTTWARCT
jgi:hypothetical protein